MSEIADNPLRKWRSAKGLSLEAMCDLFVERNFPKPSTAKLSRIERDQIVPLEMVRSIEAITGIPAKELRPDIAELLGVAQ